MVKLAKFLVIGDPHFKGNISELKEYSEKVITEAKKLKLDAIVVLGDILDNHEHVNINIFNVAEKFIGDLSALAHTFLIIGNHDYVNNRQFLTDKHIFNPFKQWKNVTVVDEPIITTIKKKDFVFCPYVENGRFLEALNKTIEYGKSWELCECVFSHVEIKGCVTENGYKSGQGNIWEEGYPFLISGHIHKSQYVGKNCFYAGSSRQVNFGELEEKFIWNVVIGDKKRIKKISISQNNKSIRELECCEIDNINCDEVFDQFTKLKIKGDISEINTFKKTKKYKMLEAAKVKMEFTLKDHSNPAVKTDIDGVDKISGVDPFSVGLVKFLDTKAPALVGELQKILQN